MMAARIAYFVGNLLNEAETRGPLFATETRVIWDASFDHHFEDATKAEEWLNRGKAANKSRSPTPRRASRHDAGSLKTNPGRERSRATAESGGAFPKYELLKKNPARSTKAGTAKLSRTYSESEDGHQTSVGGSLTTNALGLVEDHVGYCESWAQDVGGESPDVDYYFFKNSPKEVVEEIMDVLFKVVQQEIQAEGYH
ncbi:hypothetical protein NW762_012884 [Fusarium torreyae]|uniref:Uncharacterized protein n=1 Tax=Fusarium torreyae TaxID=1237075 RepID=A0A9W8RN54_9HYPO|nr:hypothetical protein NW762_012884 [Fusarium torreyae]